MIDDRRDTDERLKTWGYAVATDSFMSGWGLAPGRSIFAYACQSPADAEKMAAYLRGRSEMKRVRICGRDWRPKVRDGDHVSIRGFADRPHGL